MSKSEERIFQATSLRFFFFNLSAWVLGCGKLRSDIESGFEPRATPYWRSGVDHARRPRYRFVAVVRYILVDEGSDGRISAGYLLAGDVRELYGDAVVAAEPVLE